MVGAKIDGTQIAKGIRENLKTEIAQIQNVNPRFQPSLVNFQGVSLLPRFPRKTPRK